jgi:plasmid stability protein
MSILHVRNIPSDLYERIRRQAHTQNRSISAHVVYLLERAVQESSRSQDEILENIRRRRFYRPDQVDAPDSLSLLRQDRQR